MWQVIGQERAVSLLARGLSSGKLSHALLFTGPKHIGKMTLALNLAQALNCEAVDDRPCQQCTPCQKIAAGRHADVRIIGIASGSEDTPEAKLIGIDQIKEIRHSASLPPFEGKNKVYIIEAAELLSTEAANCLLKTLEEPEGHLTFILLTVNDRLLPATVVSRCQRIELRPVPSEKIAAVLVAKRGVAEERARLLAGLSRGCPGWAVAAATGNDVLERREKELQQLLETLNGDTSVRFNFAARLAARFGQDHGAVFEVLDLWSGYFRDIMLVKLGCPDLVANTDRHAELIDLAKRFSLEGIRGFLTSLQQAAVNLRQNVNARLALEVLMLNMPS